jgi:hypothetical protein
VADIPPRLVGTGSSRASLGVVRRLATPTKALATTAVQLLGRSVIIHNLGMGGMERGGRKRERER